jgi:hypothetical protein
VDEVGGIVLKKYVTVPSGTLVLCVRIKLPRGSVILTQRIISVMAFKETYDCEILISEIERRPALYDCSLKEYSDKGLKDRL